MASGPGGIQSGSSYEPQNLTQEQRQWLWNQAGEQGIAPVGYGGPAGALGGPRGDIATGVAYSKAIEPAMSTLKEAQAKIAPIYEQKSQAIQAEIAPTEQRYQNLLNQITANQQKSETEQTLTTSRTLGARGIAAGPGYYEQQLTSALQPIREYYTGQTKDVGYEQGEKIRGLQNLMADLANQQAQQEIGIQQYMAGLQAQAGQGSVEAALQLYQLQQSAQQAELDRQQQTKIAELSKTTAQPEYKFADVLGGGYIYDPMSGQVVNTLKDLRATLGGGAGVWE